MYIFQLSGAESDMTIDISEVKDGVSSVQITVSDGVRATAAASKMQDYLRMKNLLLNDPATEAS